MTVETLYRAALRLYPASFRRRHAGEMVRVFRARRGDARRSGGVAAEGRFVVGALADVVRTALAERWDAARAGRRGGGEEGAHSRGPRGPRGRKGRTGREGTMGGLVADLRLAGRLLMRRPGFTLLSAAVIAVGIGATTSVFSVVRSVLLAPLPYPDPDRVVRVTGELRARGVEDFPSSPPDLRDYRAAATAFDELAGVFTFGQPLTGEGEPVQLQVAGVTEGFLEVLGVRPVLGRAFLPRDFEPGPDDAEPGDPAFVHDAILLSHHLWQERWGGDPGVVGRLVDLGGTPSEVVGVLPPDFRLLMAEADAVADRPDVWVAARIDADTAPRNNVFLRLLGRLDEGADVARAQAEMDRIAADLRARFPIKEASDHRLHVRPLHAELTGPARPLLLALAGAVALVLLVTCANVSNLLLVRAAGRREEMAVRSALGGGRGRVVRQLLVESLLLAGIGGVGGVVLAAAGTEALRALQALRVPRMDEATLDLPVLAFGVALVLVSALVFGLLPALHASRTDLAAGLRGRSTRGATAPGRRLRHGIVVAEVALSLVLLVGAGLLLRSFASLHAVDPGFEPRGVLTFQTNLPFGRYAEPADRDRVNGRLREALAALPGVESVTLAYPLPLDGEVANVRWGPEEALENQELYQQADAHFVLPGYFEALGTRILAGRSFTEAENTDSAGVVILDEIMARRAFPGEDPVGKPFLVRAIGPEAEWLRVVGVVEHQRHGDLSRDGRGSVFLTHRFAGSFGGTWAVRTDGDPRTVVPGVRQAVDAIDPLLPVAELATLEARVREARAPARFSLLLMAAFAAVAALLAAVGLYGVLAHLVRDRAGEIGVRMALGAERRTIVAEVVGEGLRLTLAGVVLGLLGAFVMARALAGLLLDVSPRDPLTYAGVAVAFGVVAAVACLRPALRASRVEPARVLRGEG